MAAVEQVLTHQRWPGWRGLSAGAVRPGAQGVGVKIDAVKWGGVLLIILALMTGSAWAAWVWQANANGQQLAAKEAGLRVDVMAPSKETPSMTMAIEKYVRSMNK